jgi:phage I-like protein
MALQKDFLSARITLAEGEGGKKTPPKEFRIFESGLIDTTKGPFLFDLDSASSVLRCAAEYGNQLNVDYNHGQAEAWPVDPSLSGKSAGWYDLELRNGELWAVNVNWTPPAYAAIENREWRFISPWFSYDGETRRIHELHNVAITNTPATKHLKPLTASRLGETSTESPPMLKLLAALSLPATATEQEALNAVAARDAQMTAATALKANVDAVLSLTGAADLSAALGTMKAWQEANAALPGVQAQLSALQKASAESELKALLDEAQKAGKVPPAERPELEKFGAANLAGLKAYLNVKAPVVITEPAKVKEGVVDTSALCAEELAVAKASGISPEDFAKAKAALKKSA